MARGARIPWAMAPLFLAGAFLSGVVIGRTRPDAAPAAPTDPPTRVDASHAAAMAAPDPATDDAEPLALGDLFVQPIGPRGLELTPRVRALAGRRVRMRGFVVRQDQPTQGRFLIAPRPILLHEEEYGLADDLPAATVLVLDARAPAAVVQDAATQRPVEVVGTLAIGAREEPDGRVSLLRLTVDAAPPGAARNRGA